MKSPSPVIHLNRFFIWVINFNQLPRSRRKHEQCGEVVIEVVVPVILLSTKNPDAPAWEFSISATYAGANSPELE